MKLNAQALETLVTAYRSARSQPSGGNVRAVLLHDLQPNFVRSSGAEMVSSQIFDHVIGDAAQPPEERSRAAPFESIEASNGPQEDLLNAIVELHLCRQRIASTQIDERRHSVAMSLEKITETLLVLSFRLPDQVEFGIRSRVVSTILITHNYFAPAVEIRRKNLAPTSQWTPRHLTHFRGGMGTNYPKQSNKASRIETRSRVEKNPGKSAADFFVSRDSLDAPRERPDAGVIRQ